MGSFLGSIFGGSNPILGGDIGQAGGVAGFGTGVGEGDVGNASQFYNTILGGNPAAISKLLAPQIQTMQQQGQQQLNTASQFGNRSGGTNAAAQQNTDTTRGNIDNMISQLTGSAASGDASLGTSLLNTGLNANALQANESQQQLQNFQNSILGQGISGGLLGLEGIGLNSFGSSIGAGSGGNSSVPLLDATGGYDPLGLNAPSMPAGGIPGVSGAMPNIF